jgi:hypothetical protein
VSGNAVAAAPDANLETVAPGQGDRRHHVGGLMTAGDERRAAVDHRVPDVARVVVSRVTRSQNLKTAHAPIPPSTINETDPVVHGAHRAGQPGAHQVVCRSPVLPEIVLHLRHHVSEKKILHVN